MDVCPELEALVSIDEVMQVPIGLIEAYGRFLMGPGFCGYEG